MDQVKDFLEHHGIKGQKWGIRNKHPVVKKVTSADHRKAKTLQKKGAHGLTSNQLKIVNERLNLEQNFNRLNPGKRKKGESHVRALLATASLASSAVAVLNSPAGKLAISAGGNFMKGRKQNAKEARALVLLSKNLQKTL